LVHNAAKTWNLEMIIAVLVSRRHVRDLSRRC
jgi:hypothetical protein